MPLPRLLVTGASGFIGRHLLDGIKEDYEIVAVGRRSQAQCGAPVHPNITWFQVDIGDRPALARVFEVIRATGGLDSVIHLAAHYDFTGDDHPEYWRTNVEGLRGVLEECCDLNLRRFIFASSVAACGFPTPGSALDERSAPDGEHIYAITKRLGEEMLADFDDRVPSCIVRFAALFSDWCEYPPLYFFLETWLSSAWNARILGGRGASAIPYLHVRDGVAFLRRVLAARDGILQREVLIASPDGAVHHRELFELSTLTALGHRRRPILMPRLLCILGVWGRDLVGRVLGDRPFERPWMVRYIDLALSIDASRTRRRLDWSPRQRLSIRRRMLFMVENRKRDPLEWHRRNLAAMKEVRMRSNLVLHQLLERHAEAIRRDFTATLFDPANASRFPHYRTVSREVLAWRHTVILRHLMNAVRTGERGLFTAFCHDLAARRHEDGFPSIEVCRALEALNSICLQRVGADPEAGAVRGAMRDFITMTVQFGCDQVMETYEEIEGRLLPDDGSLGVPLVESRDGAVNQPHDERHEAVGEPGEGDDPGHPPT